ncbi:hypothetical protein RF11_07023 [Thelohanellus kitauei]|uniref:Uncharacterized protein n=1 Tax=Thelohanellus kitauei TaxID=669202 RepID=A0A0C2NLC8_THEKT|nr:hypothetical protein RF11_07023 [Thelohanellus kitauei]
MNPSNYPNSTSPDSYLRVLRSLQKVKQPSRSCDPWPSELNYILNNPKLQRFLSNRGYDVKSNQSEEVEMKPIDEITNNVSPQPRSGYKNNDDGKYKDNNKKNSYIINPVEIAPNTDIVVDHRGNNFFALPNINGRFVTFSTGEKLDRLQSPIKKPLNYRFNDIQFERVEDKTFMDIILPMKQMFLKSLSLSYSIESLSNSNILTHVTSRIKVNQFSSSFRELCNSATKLFMIEDLMKQIIDMLEPLKSIDIKLVMMALKLAVDTFHKRREHTKFIILNFESSIREYFVYFFNKAGYSPVNSSILNENTNIFDKFLNNINQQNEITQPSVAIVDSVSVVKKHPISETIFKNDNILIDLLDFTKMIPTWNDVETVDPLINPKRCNSKSMHPVIKKFKQDNLTNLVCSLCKKTFNEGSVLGDHLANCIAKEVNLSHFPCLICNDILPNEFDAVLSHCIVQHQNFQDLEDASHL